MISKEYKKEIDHYIKENYHKMTAQEIADVFSVKKHVIDCQVRTCRLRKTHPLKEAWSDADIAYLKENHRYFGLADLASALNKSTDNVLCKLKELGIVYHPRAPQSRAWSKVEDEYIFNNYKKLSGVQIAKELDRKVDSIYFRAIFLGVSSKHIIKVQWTDSQTDFLLKSIDLFSLSDLSKILNRSMPSISGKARQLGVYKKRNISSTLIDTPKRSSAPKDSELIICTQYMSNYKLKDVAINNNVAESTIMRILKKYGIPLRNGNSLSIETRQKVASLYREDKTISDIMESTGIKSEQTIYRILKELKINKRKERKSTDT